MTYVMILIAVLSTVNLIFTILNSKELQNFKMVISHVLQQLSSAETNLSLHEILNMNVEEFDNENLKIAKQNIATALEILQKYS